MQSLSLMAKITLPFTIELRNVSHSASIEESQDNDNGPCAGAATDEPTHQPSSQSVLQQRDAGDQ